MLSFARPGQVGRARCCQKSRDYVMHLMIVRPRGTAGRWGRAR